MKPERAALAVADGGAERRSKDERRVGRRRLRLGVGRAIIGMVVGFFTAWPVNAWLIRRGIKEPM